METPGSDRPLSRGKLGWFWLRLNGAHRGPNNNLAVRFSKYLVLIAAAILTLVVVFDAYSFYVARRDIDAELRSKKVSSLEYLSVLSQRKRALAITTLEGRCMERTQLTMFRILDAEHERIKAAYDKQMDIKNQIVDIIKSPGARRLIDVEEAVKFVNFENFTLTKFDNHIKALNPETANSVDYKNLRGKLEELRAKYVSITASDAPVRAEVEKLIENGTFADSKYWNMDAIKKLSDRNKLVRKELKDTEDKIGDIEDVMARYGVWTGALTGGAANNPVLDEMAYEIERANDISLAEQNCGRFKEYYAAVNNRVLKLDPLQGTPWGKLTWRQKIKSIPRYYRLSLLTYFNKPPAAQTLLVTMFLGALGALTLNMLRMSQVGWWSQQTDPLWGEIIVGPLLGALAAFGIFLIGSSGLLLTTDSSGSQPLSAYFIGLLGFLSGLLYDQAFGRVRRVGEQIFSAKQSEDGTAGRTEDRSLAETLQANGASRAAELVVKYGIGTRIGLESEFTLLIPSDEAMGRLSLATWHVLNDPQRDLFEKWYHHHHAAKRVMKKDVSGSGSAQPINELVVDDETSFALALESGQFKIANVRVLVADIMWNKGVVHILSSDLPEEVPVISG